MAGTHKITLEAPIMGHEVSRELEFREPKWRDYMKLGPAYRWVPRGDGNVIAVPDIEAIQKYAETCLVKPDDPLTLDQCEIADAMKVQELFMGFFLRAEGVAAASKISSETSSNTSSGDQPMSPT